MFTKKHILFICKDETDKIMVFLADTLRQRGNDVAVYFAQPMECVLNQCSLNENTYYKFKKMEPAIRVYDTKAIAELFMNHQNNPPVDYSYLDTIDKNYCRYKNLTQQMVADQMFSMAYHDRPTYTVMNDIQRDYWVELQCKCILDVCDTFKPDVILDLSDEIFARMFFLEVAYKRELPYISLESSRFDGLMYPTHSLGLEIDGYLQSAYQASLQKSDDELKEATDYTQNFRNQKTIMADIYKNTINADYHAPTRIQIMKRRIEALRYLYGTTIKPGNYRYQARCSYLFPKATSDYRFWIRVIKRRRKLMLSKTLFEDPIPDEKYIYLPLHLIPESTTFTKAPFYVNELNTIQQVSKALPIGWKIYVKEHQSMIGMRPVSFYQDVKKIPNVRLVRINYYKDPKPWILNAQGVITVTGTGAFEAAMLAKRSLVFADVPFLLIDGVERVHSFNELPGLIRQFGPIDNLKSCAAYVDMMNQHSKKIHLYATIKKADSIMYGKSEEDEGFRTTIDDILQLYADAYEQYTAASAAK